MKRNTKISCDVSREADNMLKAYCLKHERSKGFLLEKMIRKFCGEVEAVPAHEKPSRGIIVETSIEKPKPVKRFTKPYLIDVDNYMVEKGCLDPVTQAEKFCDFYESNGWKVGKNKMKCWKAAVRNWLKGNNNGHQKASTKLSANERVKARNDIKYRSNTNECGLGLGANDGHMGRTVDTGEGRAPIEHVGDGSFIDYD